MSILTTIETDLKSAATAIENGAVQIGKEALGIIESVGESTWTQALALIKDSPIGTAAVNMLSAVQASGGNVATALPTIITNVTGLITTLKGSNGSVIAGIETEAAGIANALVNDLKGGFLAVPVIEDIVAAIGLL